VPKNEELRVEIIQLHHDTPVAGHRGKWKTTELVTRNYWRLEVMRDMGKYVEGCNIYQRMKNRTVDFITKLPLVAGKYVILVICDMLSKMTHFMATTEGILAEGLARLFRDNV